MDDFAIYYGQGKLPHEVVASSSAQKIPYMQKPGAVVENGNIVIDGEVICATNEIKLLGEHNWQNVCAAVTLMWQLTHNIEALKSVLTTFTGLEHRLELVREVGGVSYYDDSFGSTPETAIVAMAAVKQPKVMILGGSDKGVKYDQLAEAVVKSNVKHVLTIGSTGPAIAQELSLLNFRNVSDGGGTMQQMVHRAQQKAVAGDAILLSPGCASFGLFASYKDRGEKFKAAVNNLTAALPLDKPAEENVAAEATDQHAEPV
jgi:UDP-N-acetylmuramoylalanine--D-glutamate ligase